MSLTVPEMHLVPEVERKAFKLQHTHPQVVFLSGRRTLEQQAHAMAQNILFNRRYIALTYVHTPLAAILQHWIDRNPAAVTVEQIAAGLLSVLNTATPVEQESISRHLVGRAFDVAPYSCPISALEALQPEKLLIREGGLVRWHVQWD